MFSNSSKYGKYATTNALDPSGMLTGTTAGLSNVLSGSGTGNDYGSALGAGAGALIGSALGPLGAIGGAKIGSAIVPKVMSSFGHKSSSAKKKAKSASAYNSAISGAADKLAKDYSIMDQSGLFKNNEDLLQGYYNTLKDTYNNDKKYFYKQDQNKLYQNYLNDLTNKQKATWQNDFNNMFQGYGTTNNYLDSLWNMDADNDFNQNYLDNYYNDTKTKLDSAKARGLLNEAGYNSALDTLNQRNSAASAGVNALTDSVINNYRYDLSNLAGNIQSSIDNYNLGQRHMNLGEQWNNQYNDLYGRQQKGFEGELNNALSGYTPYDVSDILANARSSQGVINPQATDDSELLSALQEKESKKNKVGLGNQGIF